jgi:acyl-CoA reductase-like NAD-dependent aldehyde dehydrogenase
MKILAIGGCGSMGRYAMRTAQNFNSVEKIVIADIDKESAETFARKIRAGQVIINGGARGTGAPFGGYKSSGNGREHGLHGLEECLETKAVIMP